MPLHEKITFQNHGPLILGSNYWGSSLALSGYFGVSFHAGAVRLLVPDRQREAISAMQENAQSILVTLDGSFTVLIWTVWKRNASLPYSIIIPGDCVFVPGPGFWRELSQGQTEWIGSVWNLKKGKPHKALERPAKVSVLKA